MKRNVFFCLASQPEKVISRLRGVFSNSVECLSVCPTGGGLCVAGRAGEEATGIRSDVCHIFTRGVESRVQQTAIQSAARCTGMGTAGKCS